MANAGSCAAQPGICGFPQAWARRKKRLRGQKNISGGATARNPLTKAKQKNRRYNYDSPAAAAGDERRIKMKLVHLSFARKRKAFWGKPCLHKAQRDAGFVIGGCKKNSLVTGRGGNPVGKRLVKYPAVFRRDYFEAGEIQGEGRFPPLGKVPLYRFLSAGCGPNRRRLPAFQPRIP